jgi:peptidoglycan/LPS O-acetylase OafA/YrhL
MENRNNLEAVATKAVVPTREKKAHLPAIDGLRGLAAMSVVFFHCWGMNGLLPTPQFTLFGVTVPVYQIFSPGYSGVYLFFALSGFCLAYPFLAHPERKDNWPGYVLNRVRRILPPYLISFVILFLIGQWLHSAQIHPSAKFLYEPFKTNRFIQELFLIRKSHVVGSYWTLVLEWRWYLFFPALLLLARRVSPALLVAALYAIALVAQKPVFAGPLNAATFQVLVTLLPVFGLGIWAAHLTTCQPAALMRWERGLLNHSLWGVIAGGAWCVAMCPPLRTGSAMEFAIAWGPLYFFLILAALNHPAFKWLFGSAPFVKLGMISYSIYLLQEPVVKAGHLFIDQPGNGNLRLLANHYLLMPILCILAGWAFYYIGERPFLKRVRK